MPAYRRLTAAGGLALAFLLFAAPAGLAAPVLDAMIGDNAVLQRDRPIRVTGRADANERLVVEFAGNRASARADRSGRWAADLPALPAGGPHRLTVTGAAGAAASADNVLVGDVWLCSGQSNMEWPVRRSLNGDAEAEGASDDRVRIVTIAQKTALSPRLDFDEAPEWQMLSPQSAAEFSAACYFMARGLRESQDVPFGLIDASWGGTRIRPWMDSEAARASGGAGDAELLDLYRRDRAAAARRFGEQWGAWWRRQSGDTPGYEPWNESDRLQWRPMPAISLWDEWEGTEFSGFNGHVWARKRFTLTAAEAASGGTLSLGIVDDLDQTWVNGVAVGSSFGWSNAREYAVAPEILRPGVNEVVVNIGDSWGAGGFQGPAERLRLTLAGGEVKPLGEGWEYSIAPESITGPPRAPWDTHAGLGTIYNAMVAPLGAIGLKGVAWYQGESDVGVQGYDRRLAAMMASWRRQFENPELPFLIVGLAGFGQPVSKPTPSGWAELQDEQRLAAAGDRNAVLVPALDIGERDDIHPPNKQEVGRRLALAARALVYADEEGKIAPLPISAQRTDGAIRVEFTRPLRAMSGARPLAFELCGETQDSCRYADSQISGNSVLIANDGRPASRVRYAWSDYPIVNLYSGGLPVPTFELPIQAR